MRFITAAARVKATEVRAGLDKSRDAAGETIALGMALAQFGGQQVGQLDLANLAFNFVIGHFRFEIVLETVLAQQLNKKLLGQIGVGGGSAFLHQKTCTPRGSY